MNFVTDVGAIPFPRFACKMAGNSFFNVDGFAHINNVAARIMKIIDTGFGRKFVKLFFRKIRWQDGFARVAFERFYNYSGLIALHQ